MGEQERTGRLRQLSREVGEYVRQLIAHREAVDALLDAAQTGRLDEAHWAAVERLLEEDERLAAERERLRQAFAAIQVAFEAPSGERPQRRRAQERPSEGGSATNYGEPRRQQAQ